MSKNYVFGVTSEVL